MMQSNPPSQPMAARRQRAPQILSALLLLALPWAHCYVQESEAEYFADFDSEIRGKAFWTKDTGAIAACTTVESRATPSATCTVTEGEYTVADLQALCSAAPIASSVVVLQRGANLTLDADLDVGALVVRGALRWTDASQGGAAEQWLCAGYVMAEGDGDVLLHVAQRRATVYIKNNGAAHPMAGIRAFGGHHDPAESSSMAYPRVSVRGRTLRRTWSLLAEPAAVGDTQLTLLHDAAAMGWAAGDRVAVAPSQPNSKGTAQTFTIAAIAGAVVTLGLDAETPGSAAAVGQPYEGSGLRRTEVINLGRSVVITGDDFEKAVPAGERGCVAKPYRSFCTLGLHTVMMHGGILEMAHARVEKCGQRGILGRYCIHLHEMGLCPDCLIEGNAVEFGQFRGIIVHRTHFSTVRDNVLYNVRGAGIYVEDGYEMHNNIMYNVAICPWPQSQENPHGCSTPGTDNGQADTALNVAGVWSLANNNNFEGNRVANYWNGLLFESDIANGDGAALGGRICTPHVPFGRVLGNVNHGNGRFGMYCLQARVYPRNVDQLSHPTIVGSLPVSGGGYDESSCSAVDAGGKDNGRIALWQDGIDYDINWVGGYNYGDIVYKNSIVENPTSDALYWKETKNSADQWSPHVLGARLEHSLSLPDARGTFLFENTTFGPRDVLMNGNHHCGVGVTGMLCNPQWVFLHSSVIAKQVRYQFEPYMIGNNINYGHTGTPNDNGVFALAPPNAANTEGRMMPAGFQAIVGPLKTYLLPIDGGETCKRANDIGAQVWTTTPNSIFCKKPVRRLSVWAKWQEADKATDKIALTVQQRSGGQWTDLITSKVPLWWINGDDSKMGFGLAVVVDDASLRYKVQLERAGVVRDLPASWVIDFSDAIMGHRFGVERINLWVPGRPACAQSDGFTVSSQHDRANMLFGNWIDGLQGACTSAPDEAWVVGPGEEGGLPELDLPTCTDPVCDACPTNAYCDCINATAASGFHCVCKPGFIGENCEVDVCELSGCSEHGRCNSRYLGSDLQIVDETKRCECDIGWYGPNCDIDLCSMFPCENGGRCNLDSIYEAIETFGDASLAVEPCTCPTPYLGKTCDKNPCADIGLVCEEPKQCVPVSETTATCKCATQACMDAQLAECQGSAAAPCESCASVNLVGLLNSPPDQAFLCRQTGCFYPSASERSIADLEAEGWCCYAGTCDEIYSETQAPTPAPSPTLSPTPPPPTPSPTPPAPTPSPTPPPPTPSQTPPPTTPSPTPPPSPTSLCVLAGVQCAADEECVALSNTTATCKCATQACLDAQLASCQSDAEAAPCDKCAGVGLASMLGGEADKAWLCRGDGCYYPQRSSADVESWMAGGWCCYAGACNDILEVSETTTPEPTSPPSPVPTPSPTPPPTTPSPTPPPSPTSLCVLAGVQCAADEECVALSNTTATCKCATQACLDAQLASCQSDAEAAPCDKCAGVGLASMLGGEADKAWLCRGDGCYYPQRSSADVESWMAGGWCCYAGACNKIIDVSVFGARTLEGNTMPPAAIATPGANNLNAILGGVLGGVVFLCMALAAAFYVNHQRKLHERIKQERLAMMDAKRYTFAQLAFPVQPAAAQIPRAAASLDGDVSTSNETT